LQENSNTLEFAALEFAALEFAALEFAVLEFTRSEFAPAQHERSGRGPKPPANLMLNR